MTLCNPSSIRKPWCFLAILTTVVVFGTTGCKQQKAPDATETQAAEQVPQAAGEEKPAPEAQGVETEPKVADAGTPDSGTPTADQAPQADGAELAEKNEAENAETDAKAELTPEQIPEAIARFVANEPPIAKSLADEIEFPHCIVSMNSGHGTTEKTCRISPSFVQNLIDSGADVNQYNEYGQTPLMLVDDIKSIKKLIAAGANVHHEDDYSHSAFDYAEKSATIDVLMKDGKGTVEDLKSIDDDILEALNYPIATIFRYGAFNGMDVSNDIKDKLISQMDIEIAKQMLDKGWIDTDELKRQFLFTAIEKSFDYTFVESLYERGFSIKPNQLTELLKEKHSPEILDLLIQKGANINEAYVETSDDAIALDLKNKGAKYPSTIQPKEIRNTTIWDDAVQNVTGFKEKVKDDKILFEIDQPQILTHLISLGANIHVVDSNGNTLLHHNHDNLECTKVLLKAGLDPNAVNNNKQTPLFDANYEVAEALIKAGANVNAVDDKNRSVAIYAYENIDEDRYNNYELLKVLAKHKASDLKKRSKFLTSQHCKTFSDLEIQINDDSDDDSCTVDRIDKTLLSELPDAVQSKYEDLPNYDESEYYYFCAMTSSDCDDSMGIHTRDDRYLRAWLAKGGNPNSRDTNGRTPLFHVLFSKEARLLLAAGADVNAVDKYGNTPLLALLAYAEIKNGFTEYDGNDYVDDDEDYGGSDGERYCLAELVRVFLKAGADVTIVNKQGKSAKDYRTFMNLLHR